MYALPFDGDALVMTFAHLGQERTVRLDGLMTIHAGLRIGNRGVRRALDIRVAVDARHAQLARMKLMRERHRLLRRVADARDLGPERQPESDTQQPSSQHTPAKELPEQSVRSWLKDHRGLTSTTSQLLDSLAIQRTKRGSRSISWTVRLDF